MKALFGTDGIRGEAGKFPLDRDTVKRIGFSLASYLNNKAKGAVIVIGRDTRESGAWLEQSLIEGATSAGAECHSAGVITTPGVAYLTGELKANAGVVISASHNPYHDNGIKIFSASGQKIDDEVERLIEADIYAAAGQVSTLNANETPADEEDQLQARYLDFLSNRIAQDLSLNGLKIVVDCANGASYRLAPALFERLGANVVAINREPDGKNINLNSGSLHIEGLQERVVSEKADLGVAFDGDADRSLFVDHEGKFVDGDATLWVLADYLQAKNELKANTVVATVMSNIGLEIALRGRGIKLVRTDVGDKYVLETLLRLDASLGGEQSGHVILPALSLAGDGMITTLLLLRALQESQSSLAEMTKGLQRYPQTLVNVRVKQKRPFVDLAAVTDATKEVEQRLGENGRLLLRYSGTEPVARVMIEGQNQADIDAYARKIAAALEQELGV
ncbi:MAG TPA: phosphoglucosamine mutase [Pyrinomonadaceae bacterium]|nr:phosphoglucosamine mutase [Pyrinomonadaceae bacterium]